MAGITNVAFELSDVALKKSASRRKDHHRWPGPSGGGGLIFIGGKGMKTAVGVSGVVRGWITRIRGLVAIAVRVKSRERAQNCSWGRWRWSDVVVEPVV